MWVTGAVLTSVLAALLLVHPADAQWRGHVSSRRSCSCSRSRVCAFRFWGICCTWKWIWRTSCHTNYFCTPGWKETYRGSKDCSKPICSPGCQFGGTCVRPNQCRCPRGRSGPTCAGTLPCDVLEPCFPGNCTNSCSCNPGFSSGKAKAETCTQLADSERPRIWKCSATLKNVVRASGVVEYEYMTDSSNPDEDVVDTIWSNYGSFNYLAIDGFADYDPEVPANPTYVRNSRLGVIGANVEISHTKLNRNGPGRRPVQGDPRTLPCSPADVSQCSTVSGQTVCPTWNCSVMLTEYETSLETGDEISVKMQFSSGGFRDVSTRGVQTFKSVSKEQQLIFKFDLHDPEHPCQNSTHNCKFAQKPLDVGPAFTKRAIPIVWDGWRDTTAGMFRYVWEVFRLEPNSDGQLEEKHPLSPLNNITSSVVFHSQTMNFPTFLPSQPGRYSVILQAADAANNSLYVRQFVLFDDQSRVDVDYDQPITVAQAVSGRGLWVNDGSTRLTMGWVRHFVNQLQEDGHFLGPILPYPRQFADAELSNMGKAKFIIDEVSIGRGQTRTVVVEEEPNQRGVRRFRVQQTGDGTRPTPQDWIAKNLSLQHTFSVSALLDGQATQLWVEAEDYMGNTRTDSVLVRFDSSPPRMDARPRMTRSVPNGEYAYSSRMHLAASDVHSGVAHFRFQFTRNDTHDVIHNVTVKANAPVKRSECRGAEACTCVSDDECYRRNVSLDLNNCWLQVEHGNVSHVAVNVTVTPVNSAGLAGPSTFIMIDDLPSLAGINELAGPTDLYVVSLTDTSVTLNWTNLPTCFEVTEWWVAYMLNGEEVKYYVDRRESVFRLPDLSPSTPYTISVLTGYHTDGLMSNPATISFTTAPAPGLTAGQTAGAVVGSLLLIGILATVIVGLLYTNGLLFTLLQRSKRKEKLASTPLRKGPGVDDDLYIYGGGAGGIPYSRQVAADRLTLIEVIKEGNFARIYRASLQSEGGTSTVAAKMLREDHLTEDDQQLMLAKIGFQATALGTHPHLLQFLGAVLDNDSWGPVMLLEHCENGTLNNWLTSHRSNVTDDIIERLFHFVFGILKAMEYLSSLGIVHTRLATRNVYLTFLLEAKVAGLGPSSLPGDQAKERLPVRWLPPECSQSLQDADQSTDVWSFGVTLWEIFTMGEKPYSNLDVHNIPHEVKRGFRLAKPEYCDDINYAIMQRCWAGKSEARPSFQQLLEQYERLMAGDPLAGDYDYGKSKF